MAARGRNENTIRSRTMQFLMAELESLGASQGQVTSEDTNATEGPVLRRTRQRNRNLVSSTGGSNQDNNTDSDEEPDCGIESECFEGKKGCRKARRGKSEEVAPLGDTLAQVTKMRTSANKNYEMMGSMSAEGLIPTLAMLKGREINISGNGKWSRAECRHMGMRYIPENGPHTVGQMRSRAYVGRFSADGSLFVAGFQDRRIQIYNVEKGWELQKSVSAWNLCWTVTDIDLSHDKRFLIYCTNSPSVHLVNIARENGLVESLANVTDIHEELDFSIQDDGEFSFGLYSIQFSHDGREIVGGSNDRAIYIYDLESCKSILRLEAHEDDVNAVRFADESCNLLYSGSDDNSCKVWDRRCISSKGSPTGILIGHLEGVTFIDSRGDGRYFISNGKDQTCKLWDIRKMSNNSSQRKMQGAKLPFFRWDYRRMDYPGCGKDLKHPYDQSVMTYRGHSVLKTLIRCYFSPEFMTGQKYIYTGSHDGCVYIYDLVSAKIVAKLGGYHKQLVRDCSWHPTEPLLVSSSWDGKIAQWEYSPGLSSLPSNQFT